VKAKAFDHADANGDKRLDQAELQTAFDAVAAKTGGTARDAATVIAKIDSDGDGLLSRKEIRAGLRDLRPVPTSTVALAKKDGGDTVA
jgi:Ca2+-binding EF-hand superfamily protein